MLSLILLIAAGFVTSSSAVSLPSWRARRGARRKFEDNVLRQISVGILALCAVTLAVNVQLGSFR